MVDGDPEKIIPLVRQAVELGADIIKADPTDDVGVYHKVIETAGGGYRSWSGGGGKAPGARDTVPDRGAHGAGGLGHRVWAKHHSARRSGGDHPRADGGGAPGRFRRGCARSSSRLPRHECATGVPVCPHWDHRRRAHGPRGRQRLWTMVRPRRIPGPRRADRRVPRARLRFGTRCRSRGLSPARGPVGFRDMGDEVEEGEMHLRTGLGLPDDGSVVRGTDAQIRPALAPSGAQLVRRDREGEKAVAGFETKNPKPFSSSGRTRFLYVTSLASMISRTQGAARLAVRPRGTSPRTTQTSASKSSPHAASGKTSGSVGARRTPEPP